MFARPPDARQRSRALAAGLSAGVQLAALLMLWLGLAPPPGLRQAASEALSAFTVIPPVPAPKPPPRQRRRAASGRAAPANTRSRAAAVFAASPLPVPPPIPTSPKPAQGEQRQSGAALAGPGSGAGGNGNGTGSGASGTGNGDDGNGDGGSDPEWVSGAIRNSDYPKGAYQAHAQGTTRTRITVGTDGRPTGCALLGSSGNAELDDTTCRLVLRRFRFRPAENAHNQPEVATVDYDQEWTTNGSIGD